MDGKANEKLAGRQVGLQAGREIGNLAGICIIYWGNTSAGRECERSVEETSSIIMRSWDCCGVDEISPCIPFSTDSVKPTDASGLIITPGGVCKRHLSLALYSQPFMNKCTISCAIYAEWRRASPKPGGDWGERPLKLGCCCGG